jgi:hypothetical protein
MGGCSSKTEPQNRLQMLEQRVETLTKMLETSDNNATKTSVITKVEEKQVHQSSFVDQENRLRFAVVMCLTSLLLLIYGVL